MTREAKEFSLLDGPPDGRLAIEASAGTGKTFTLAGLATSYLAEGRITASQLLMVTFTRAATEELRARVRERLTQAAAVLADELPLPADDEFLAELVRSDRDGERLRRLRNALAEFDSATIITIHGFARQIHRTLGISGAIDPDARLVSDGRQLVAEVCTDLLVSEATSVADADELPAFADLVAATAEAVSRDNIVVLPDSDQPGATEAQRRFRDLVLTACDEFDRRRRQSATIGFDDLLVQLRDAISDPSTGRAVVHALSDRYKVALIDEFQDTDSVQWEIFSALFGDGSTDNVLITVGDPKQAIYRFRGADIHTYLRAVGPGSGVTTETLRVNWRSDEAVLDGLGHFFDGATFGDPAIAFQPVGVPDGHRGERFRVGDDADPPTLAVRIAAGPGVPHSTKDPRFLRVDDAFDVVHADVAAYVAGLLDAATVPDGEDGGFRKLRASDIGILVTITARGEALQQVLIDAGIPAVVAADGNVLQSTAAIQLRTLLRAMARPFDPRRVHAFALSWFAGWTAERVVVATDDDWMVLGDRLTTWAGLLARNPVADVLAHIWKESEVVTYVLARRDGDRNVTDLDHLAELLHDAAPRGRSTVAGLLAILESPPDDDADTEADGSVAARRIEADLDAVQIMTVWKAKGLEFPVVCVPGLWWRYNGGLTLYAEQPDDADAAPGAESPPVRWVLDVAGGTGWPDEAAAEGRLLAAEAERRGEDLRLLYVALTRACHLTAVWWANLAISESTALAHFLFARNDGRLDPVAFAEPSVPVPGDDDIMDQLGLLTAAAHGRISVTAIGAAPLGPGRAEPRRGDPSAPYGWGTAAFDRRLDRSVNRWSFSSITDQVAAADVDPYDDSLGDAGATDEGGADADRLVGRSDADGGVERSVGTDYVPGLLTTLPAGTEFGTLVHAVLEHVDFASDRLGEDLTTAVGRELDALAFDPTPRDTLGADAAGGARLLVEGLAAAIGAPLGPLFYGARLADLGASDRLNELSFDLHLGAPGHTPSLRAVGALVADHLPDADPLRPWAVDLAGGPADVRLSGHLTGSIDLIARVGSPGAERYVVADYKTNQLVGRGDTPSLDDYAEAALARAMAAHDYPLQALLYSVALHRYLAWRRPGYVPDRHLGGAAYLFVRGMTGSGDTRDAGTPPGVFSWPVPAALVCDLSDLLAGRRTGDPDV